MSTRRFYLVGFAALILFDTLTQVSFKLASERSGPFEPQLWWLHEVATSGWIFGALIGYACAFVTWMTLLKHAPVGPAFAASHLEVVTVLIVSIWVFGEQLSAVQVAGALCIVLGIVCLSLSEGRRGDA